MVTRYVVARYCFGGIGDHLLCLIGSWWLAQRTGRTLVVDWRGSRFNPDPTGRINCFHIYFEPRDTLGGIPVIADDSVNSLNLPSPMWPPKWTPSKLAGLDHLKHTASEIADVNRLVTSNEDATEPTVVLNQWIEPMPPRDSVRKLLRDLRPVETIAAEANRFWTDQIGDADGIAIHVRHGNGENIGDRAAYWLGPLALIRQLKMNGRNDMHRRGLYGRFSDNAAPSLVGSPDQARAEHRFCKHIARKFQSFASLRGLTVAVPLLFCDSEQIVRTMRIALPGLVVLRKRLLASGEGPLHQFDPKSVSVSAQGDYRGGTISGEITREMFLELELMRRCKALICMDSGFSILSRIELDADRISYLEPNLLNIYIKKIMHRLNAH